MDLIYTTFCDFFMFSMYLFQGDLIPSSGESATERAMLEMPIPEIVTLPPPSSIVLADLRRENQRLQKLVREEDGSQLPAIRPIDIAPLDEASFSQVRLFFHSLLLFSLRKF